MVMQMVEVTQNSESCGHEATSEFVYSAEMFLLE